MQCEKCEREAEYLLTYMGEDGDDIPMYACQKCTQQVAPYLGDVEIQCLLGPATVTERRQPTGEL